MKLTRTIASVGLLTGANGVNALLAFGASVLAARALEPGAFGKLAVLMVTGAFLSIALDLGMNQILTRRIAVRSETRLLGDMYRMRVYLAGALTALGGAALLAAAARGAHPLSSDVGGWTLLGISSCWQLVFTTEQARAQGLQKFPALAMQMIAVNLFRVVLVGIARLAGGAYELLLVGYMLPPVLAGAASAVRWRRLLRPDGSYRLVRHLLPVIGLAGVVAFLTSIVMRVSLWMVALQAGNAAAGKYAVAFQAASLVFTFGTAMASFLLPHVTILDRSGRARGFLSMYLRRSVPMVLAMLVAAFVFSSAVPHFFGHRYAGTEMPTFLLMTSFLVSILNSPFYALQQARFQYRFLVLVHLGQVILLVLGCFAAVPRWGGTGAALSEVAVRVLAVAVVIVRGFADTAGDVARERRAAIAPKPALD